MHLKFWYEVAQLNGEYRHAQEVMKDLGITYTHSTPQSAGSQFWFWNCENVPNQLPNFLDELKGPASRFLGWGLTKKEAKEIDGYKKYNL